MHPTSKDDKAYRSAGTLLSFTDGMLTPRIASIQRLAWREMGDSVMTAKRALKIGRFQLQELQLNDPESAEHAASLTRIDSAHASAYMELARFFLANASPREPEITDLLAEFDEIDDAPSAVHSCSASLSTSDMSVTMQGSRVMRQGAQSYAGPELQQAPPRCRPASPATAGGSLAARSNSFGSMA